MSALYLPASEAAGSSAAAAWWEHPKRARMIDLGGMSAGFALARLLERAPSPKRRREILAGSFRLVSPDDVFTFASRP